MSELRYNCPFCSCFFFSEHDLNLHIKAFIIHPLPSNVPAVNEVDHKRMFKVKHKSLEEWRWIDFD